MKDLISIKVTRREFNQLPTEIKARELMRQAEKLGARVRCVAMTKPTKPLRKELK